MTRRSEPAHYSKLAALQDLVALERRRDLERACAETDQRTREAAQLAEALAAAEAGLSAVHAAERLCPDRLRYAAAIVGDSDLALGEGRTAVARTAEAERLAGSAWLMARHRTEWFGDRASQLEKRAMRKRDDAAEAEARMLRMTLNPGRGA